MTTSPGDYRDPESHGNSAQFRTGHLCVERGCPFGAGTFWSHLWCVQHNIVRMDRIDSQFATLTGRRPR